MYYFLGLTLQEDINKGSFYPSFILCKAYVSSNSRTGYRVAKQLDGNPSNKLPRVLVTETTGHDDLLNFLSVYQTQDNRTKVHYHPVGALCWYACNKYGEPTGEVVFARKVPIKGLMWNFGLKRKFRTEAMNRKKEFKEAFAENDSYEEYKTVKPRLYQSLHLKTKKGKKKNGSKQNKSVN